MHHEYVYCLAVGSVLGLALFIYSAVRAQPRRIPDLGELLESIGRGALIGAGFHLSFCCVFPELLVHAVDAETGGLIHLPDHSIYQMDAMHRVHVFTGGIATVFLAAKSLVESCLSMTGRNDNEIEVPPLDQTF